MCIPIFGGRGGIAEALGMEVPTMLTEAYPTEEILPFETESAPAASEPDEAEKVH